MVKSNTKSNKIQLPHKCSCTEISVTPANWLTKEASTETDWVMCYTFFDPDYPKGLRKQVRGMNDSKDLSARRKVTQTLIMFELERLQEGYNPFKKKTIAVQNTSELHPDTPFIAALWIAVEKIKVVRAFYLDIKSVIRGVEKSARQLGIDRMPIKEVSRKYFKMIFEQCFKNNTRFTNTTQNRYKNSLSLLYVPLMDFEAVEVNPLRDIKKLKTTKKERVIPTAEERLKIDSFLQKNFYTFWRTVQLFFHSGARETELMQVQKKDVDFTKGQCKYTVRKGLVSRPVWRPITDSVIHLWKEAVGECKSMEDYLFAKGLKPGKVAIRTEQLGRRWTRHVKGFDRHGKVKAGKLGIKVDFYTLKHLNTTEVMDELDRDHNYDPTKDVMRLTAHTNPAMIVNIYDKNNKTRKDDKVKKVSNTFAK